MESKDNEIDTRWLVELQIVEKWHVWQYIMFLSHLTLYYILGIINLSLSVRAKE